MYILLGVCNNVIKWQTWSWGWIQKIRKEAAQTLASYIIYYYIFYWELLKNDTKFHRQRGCCGPLGQPLNLPMGPSHLVDACLSAMCYESVPQFGSLPYKPCFCFFFPEVLPLEWCYTKATHNNLFAFFANGSKTDFNFVLWPLSQLSLQANLQSTFKD